MKLSLKITSNELLETAKPAMSDAFPPSQEFGDKAQVFFSLKFKFSTSRITEKQDGRLEKIA